MYTLIPVTYVHIYMGYVGISCMPASIHKCLHTCSMPVCMHAYLQVYRK